MSLFDLLIQQLEGNDDSSSGLLDRDLKNSVLGEISCVALYGFSKLIIILSKVYLFDAVFKSIKGYHFANFVVFINGGLHPFIPQV